MGPIISGHLIHLDHCRFKKPRCALSAGLNLVMKQVMKEVITMHLGTACLNFHSIWDVPKMLRLSIFISYLLHFHFIFSSHATMMPDAVLKTQFIQLDIWMHSNILFQYLMCESVIVWIGGGVILWVSGVRRARCMIIWWYDPKTS